MINLSVLSDDLWQPAVRELKPNKLIVTDKILKRARNNYCSCVFCALKGEHSKNEELIEKVIMDYIANFEDHRWSRPRDYINPISLLEILIKFVYDNEVVHHSYYYYPGSNNLTPLMKELLKSGFSQSEMDTILEKFTYKIQNEIDSDWDILPF